MHEKEARQTRRNRLSDKTNAAFEQIYELAQSEKLAEENQTRASMYAVLSRLAAVNELILNDAGEEEILSEIQKLKEDDVELEESTRELEARAQAKAKAT